MSTERAYKYQDNFFKSLPESLASGHYRSLIARQMMSNDREYDRELVIDREARGSVATHSHRARLQIGQQAAFDYKANSHSSNDGFTWPNRGFYNSLREREQRWPIESEVKTTKNKR